MDFGEQRDWARFHRVPGHLVTVFDFVNTLDERRFGGSVPGDTIADPSSLAVWLSAHGIPGTGPKATGCTPEEHALALRLRGVLREATLANRTGHLDDAAVDRGTTLAEALPLEARTGTDGRLGLRARAGGVPGALAGLLATVVLADADGSWKRMKMCAAHDCRFVFYDHAKPGNGRWCSTEGCGNRNKTRTYRRRHTAAQH